MRWILSLLLAGALMAAGVTSDATDIMILDDTNAAAGGDGSYSFADIYTALGGTGVDVLRVDSGTGVPHYRFLKHLQIGDKTTTASTTTLKDSNCVVTFDAGKVLKTRATQTTSWFIELGTKVGAGSQASGKKSVILTFHNTTGTNSVILRGSVKLYGCTFKSTASGGVQALQFPNQTSGASEFINCIHDGFTSYVYGSTGNPIETLYNLDITGDASNLITSFFVNSAERLTIGGAITNTFLSSATAGITLKDVIVFGSASNGSFNATGLDPNWAMIGVTYLDGVNKFATIGGSGSDDNRANNGSHDWIRYDVKVVDSTGVGIAGIPVKLTDAQGNVQINTVTGSTGRITYGSGATANRVIVADHYAAGGSTPSVRQRSKFFAQFNTGAGANPAYETQEYYFDWPGSSTYTTTSGSLEDVADIVRLRPRTPSPVLVANIPASADNELRYLVEGE